MIPAIDAHHHVWRKADLPWLAGAMEPRIFGPYEAIKRDYLMEEFLWDIADTGVVASVYVQANWPPERAEDEVAWVSEVAAETGWPPAIVGYADFTGDDVRPALDRLERYPLMRGIRQQFHWHDEPLYRFAARPDLCEDANVRRNIARLADYGWSFDLQVFAPQMAGAAWLAASCPEVTFVLQHAGMWEESVPREEWHAGMARLADCPNVVTKTSGLGTFLHEVDLVHIADITETALELFGPDRCLWGSNFPIEKLWTSYAELIAAHRAALDPYPDATQRAVLHDTAARIYRIDHG